MQLKFKRYSGSKGLVFNTTTYCLEAVLLACQEEHERISTYNRWNSNVSSLGDLDHHVDDEEFYKQIMKISMSDLAHGARFEYTNFNSVIRTENIIAKACKELLSTVNCLATFDGTERVVELDESHAEVVAAG